MPPSSRAHSLARPIRPRPAWALVALLLAGGGICKGPPLMAAAAGAATLTTTNTAFNLSGQPFDPFAARADDVVVLIFVGVDCPISNRYAPEVRRLCEQFARRPVSFWLVQPDADVTAAAMGRHVKDFNYPCEALRDPHQVLVRKAQATKVPEGAVFDRAGKLVYHGRINNRYADFGRARPQATEHDLRDAIEATLAGRAPVHASVPAVGCHIPDLR